MYVYSISTRREYYIIMYACIMYVCIYVRYSARCVVYRCVSNVICMIVCIISTRREYWEYDICMYAGMHVQRSALLHDCTCGLW